MNSRIACSFLLYCISFTASSQNTLSIGSVTEKIQKQLEKNPVLIIQAELNSTIYSPGDTVFFKSYFSNTTNILTKGKAIHDIFIHNANGVLVNLASFKTVDGIGYSYIQLPDTLKAGLYRISIVNEWMRNFHFIPQFEEYIQVVRNGILAKNERERSVTFFVEGGKMISSAPNKIFVKSNEPNAQLSITSDDSQEITTVTLDENGEGVFSFIPKANVQYFGSIGATDRFRLPKADENNLSAHINWENETVNVSFYTGQNSSFRSENLFMFLIANDRVVFSSNLSLAEKEFVTISLPKKKIPTGVSQIVVLDKNFQLVTQRCFFDQQPSAPINNVYLNKESYEQRDLAKVHIGLSDENKNPIRGEFSVSVINQQLFADVSKKPFNPQNISYLLRGTFNSRELEKINNRLIAFGGFYNWHELLTGASPQSPIKTMLYKSGKAYIRSSQQPVPDSTKLFVYLQKNFIGYETTVLGGEFDVAFLFDFMGVDELFYMAEHKGKLVKDVAIEWREAPVPTVTFSPWRETPTRGEYSKFQANSKLVRSSFNFFALNKTGLPEPDTNPNAEFEDEFLGADLTVNIDDYLVFPTMEELIREVVPSLQHRKMKGANSVRVVFSKASIIPSGDPLYIIDGIMTKNTDFFLSLKPSEIATIKVAKEIMKLSRLGTIGKNGIVYVQTKKKDVVDRLKRVNTVLPIQGLNAPVKPSYPSYESIQNWRIPDFRSTIYWNPSVKTEHSGEATLTFFWSDDVGPMMLRIRGLTESGQPFAIDREIKVNFKANTEIKN